VFTPAYKLAMVAEYENAPNGEKGAILRREGLYSSHIVEWTRARDAGVLSGDPAESAAPAKRAKKAAERASKDARGVWRGSRAAKDLHDRHLTARLTRLRRGGVLQSERLA
jgi:hypothetical protein